MAHLGMSAGGSRLETIDDIFLLFSCRIACGDLELKIKLSILSNVWFTR